MTAPELPDPRKSQVVLIGVSKHTDPELPGYAALKTGVEELARLLQRDDVWGVPKSQCHIVSGEEATWDNISETLRVAAEVAESALVVYYGGHGVLDRHGTDTKLLLAPRTAKHEHTLNWVDFGELRRHLQHGAPMAKHRILLLDCCHSGEAINRGALDLAAGPWQEDDRANLSTLITSCEKFERAHVPESNRYSVFVAALIDILTTGVSGAGKALTPEDLHKGLRSRIGGMQTPRMLCADGAAAVPLFLNRQHRAVRAGPTADSMTSIAPGWYPDPADPAVQRYWDGTTWVGLPVPADAASPAALEPPQDSPSRTGPPPHQKILHSESEPRPPRSQMKRPVPVIAAVLIQWLLAISVVIWTVAGYVFSPYFKDAYDAEIARQLGVEDLPTRSSDAGDLIGAPSLVTAAVVVAALVVLALLNAAGKRLGRSLTWIFHLLVLAAAGYCLVGWLLYVPTLQWVFDNSGDEWTEDLNAAALVDAMFPASFLALVWITAALAGLGSLLVITLLAVPSSHAFFRKPRRSPNLLGAAGADSGKGAVADVPSPRGRLRALLAGYWRALVERGSKLVNGRTFLVLGIAALVIGALCVSAELSTVRREVAAELSSETGDEKSTAVGLCLPYDLDDLEVGKNGMAAVAVECDAPTAFWEITAESYDIDAPVDEQGKFADNQPKYDVCGEGHGAVYPGEPLNTTYLVHSSSEAVSLHCLQALGNPDPNSEAHTPFVPDEGTCLSAERISWTVDCASAEADYNVVGKVVLDEPRSLSDDEVAQLVTCGGQKYSTVTDIEDRTIAILCVNER